jgi:hypothetical protein
MCPDTFLLAYISISTAQPTSQPAYFLMAIFSGNWRNSKYWRATKKQVSNLVNYLKIIWSSAKPIWVTIIVLLVLATSLLLLRRSYFFFGDISQGIYIEAWGSVIDIFIIGIILALFTRTHNKKERIQRYIEEIEDFKKWDTEEARLRFAGNIRRLAKLGRTDIDFSGLVLCNFSFYSNDIENIRGAIFSLGLRLDKMSKNSTKLENVDFTHVDCSDVTFSKSFSNSSGLGLIGNNISFTYANLNIE